MILILAEKAKAARRIAEILSGGSFQQLKLCGYTVFRFFTDRKEYMVVPLRGHVLDADFPREYSRWSLEGLRNLVHAPFVIRPILDGVIRLLGSLRRRTDLVIVATDADREGEAIGAEVVEYIFRGIPVRRAWFSALTPSEIRRAFSSLIEPKRGLAEAAFTRREVDLLWGAVLTRALSLTSGRRGKEFLSVGRVQTPTLALVVEREREIRSFVPRIYYVVAARFGGDSPFWAINPRQYGAAEEAREVADSVRGKDGTVKSFNRLRRSIPRPAPFDTTTFLSEASKLLGLSPKKALEIAEDLYMEGLISYPRTDNQTYPEGTPFNQILSALSQLPEYKDIIASIRRPYRPSRGRRTEDHPPIHPVDVPRTSLTGNHAKVYDLVVRRFLATLMDEGVVEERRAVLDVAGIPFEAKGRELLEAGWMRAYPVKIEETPLPVLDRGSVLPVLDVKVEKRRTKPPSRYTAGELVKKMESLGLGTKSTRAEILAKLYNRGYIEGRKRIRPTSLGELVYDLLKDLVPEILSPDLTSSLEKRLLAVERGEESREEVVKDARSMLAGIVEEFLRRKDRIRRVVRDGAAS